MHKIRNFHEGHSAVDNGGVVAGERHGDGIVCVNWLLLTYSLTHSLTNSLTPHSTVLLKKLTGLQPVKKFPAFYGTRRFITTLTSACHLSLS
jgi:hypothetical protein